MAGIFFPKEGPVFTKVIQSLLLTGNSLRLLVFGTNLIACRCQCSLARHATAIARSPFTSWSLDRYRLRHRRCYSQISKPALSRLPPPSLARLPAPACHRHRMLAIAAIVATQACSPLPPRCAASTFSLAAPPTPALDLPRSLSLPRIVKWQEYIKL